MNRGDRPNPTVNSSERAELAAASGGGSSRRKQKYGFLHISTSVWLISTSILMIAVILSLFFLRTDLNDESRLVAPGRYQAVFLNGGQVYFGKIGALNPKVLTLYDIYYLRVNQQVQPGQANAQQNEITLAKLGCELHGPADQMVVNREQVVFWENLKDDGQVAKAVAEYRKQNPNGQKCDAPAADTTKTDSTKKP